MELLTLNREKDKNQKDMLLNLVFSEKTPFIVMMSSDFFSAFLKCDGVDKDDYSLDSLNSYFVKGNDDSIKIDAIESEDSYLIRIHKKKKNRKPAEIIYYFI